MKSILNFVALHSSIPTSDDGEINDIPKLFRKEKP
jgi:hypothetical protein